MSAVGASRGRGTPGPQRPEPDHPPAGSLCPTTAYRNFTPYFGALRASWEGEVFAVTPPGTQVIPCPNTARCLPHPCQKCRGGPAWRGGGALCPLPSALPESCVPGVEKAPWARQWPATLRCPLRAERGAQLALGTVLELGVHVASGKTGFRVQLETGPTSVGGRHGGGYGVL